MIRDDDDLVAKLDDRPDAKKVSKRSVIWIIDSATPPHLRGWEHVEFEPECPTCQAIEEFGPRHDFAYHGDDPVTEAIRAEYEWILSDLN